MSYPKHIPGTWHFSGDWLGSYRIVGSQDLDEPLDASTNITCPICEYPEAIHISKYSVRYPLHYWCLACETIWQWYAARCPDCDGGVWKKGCKPDKVVCSVCGLDFDQEFIQEFNEDPNFHSETIEEEL